MAAPRRGAARRAARGGRVRRPRTDPPRGRSAHPEPRLNETLVGRIRSEIAGLAEPAALLDLYADPSGRAVLRERVRALAAGDLGGDDRDLDEICAELFGFGPLQPLLEDPLVTDVLVNGPDDVYVERAGVLARAPVRFRDRAAVGDLAYRIAANVGRELTVERPFVDARLRDGSRANAVIEPVGGPTICIRRFRTRAIALAGPAPSWQASSGLDDATVAWLERAVRGRANVLVSGATGSGKSTLLRSLATAIPGDERLVVIEDTSELRLPHPHVVRLECVPGRDGGVALADLVANALRMRPDRIVVGEVRTPREASALLEALSTGHAGALTTVHAGSATDALARLELLLARAGELSAAAIERHVRRTIDCVVHVRRRDGARAIVEVATIDPQAGERIVWRAA